MPTMRDPADRAAILTRLDRLQTTSTPRWGRMNVAQMLSHLCDSCRMALGDMPVKSRNFRLAHGFPVKHLMLYVLPFPKSAPTAPELLSSTAESFDGERDRLKRLIARMDPLTDGTRAKEHPLFGALTPDEWGVLGYKHSDHHLRQFGV